jgi:hypothetical protein
MMAVEFAQGSSQSVGAASCQQALSLRMFPFPHRCGGGEQRSAGRRQYEAAAAFVGAVHVDFQKAAAFERLEIGGESRAIHGEERRNVTEARRLGAIERHQQRELALCQIEWPQRIVKAPGQRARGPLDVQTKAAVANLASEREGHILARTNGI